MKKTLVIFAVAAMSIASIGQTNATASSDSLLDRNLQHSMLTYDGKPFHAVLEIGDAGNDGHESLGPDYKGSIEVWWAGESSYRFSLVSPQFTQQKIVDGDDEQEEHTGDFLPRWLDSFIKVFINPVPVHLFRASAGAVQMGGNSLQSCIRRDDRPGGITDQMTWGQVCFDSSNTRVQGVTTFNYSIFMQDWQAFDGKEIARRYETSVLSHKQLFGRLTTLEPLSIEDQAKIVVAKSTPPAGRVQTTFVSTAEEESNIDHAPSIQWPSVREGKSEGYMIVYARTDSTGQVRETAAHNSDNAGLENFGMEQALKYKFKPVLVDGNPAQIEMPLVLHFSTHIDGPILILKCRTNEGTDHLVFYRFSALWDIGKRANGYRPGVSRSDG